MNAQTIAIAGGSGFVGRGILRRLALDATLRLRVLTRDRERTRRQLSVEVELVEADATDTASLDSALAGAEGVIDCVQFDGFPVENPHRGLTFERVDYGGCVALLAAAARAGARRFVYISGVGADERSAHPAYRAKGRAERVIRESGLDYTILRPSLIYGPGDRLLSGLARALRFAPILALPGGAQKLSPVALDDVAECVARALAGRGVGGTYAIGGPQTVTLEDLVRQVMKATGVRRPIVRIPPALLAAAGVIAQRLPGPRFTRDAAAFILNDSDCDSGALVREFGIEMTPLERGLAYLVPDSASARSQPSPS